MSWRLDIENFNQRT